MSTTIFEKLFSNIDAFMGNTEKTFGDIEIAHLDHNGYLKNPSDLEQARIETDIASWDILGRGFIVGSGACFAGSYIVWGIPFLGPLLGIGLVITGIAWAVLGHDACRCAANLEPFAALPTAKTAARSITTTDDCQRDAHQKFNKLLLDLASQYTLLGRMAYKVMIACQML